MSYTLTAKIIGDTELRDVMRRAPKEVAKQMGDAIQKTAYETESRAKGFAPAQFGDLRRSIETKGPYVTSDNIFATVSTDKNYALAQEQGSGLYGPKGQLIKPKSGKVMAWRSGGKMVYAKSSKGVKPKWYMKQAREQARPLLTDHLRIAMGKILSFLAK